MKQRSPFRSSRLYSQIVYPLLLGAVFVGIIATLIAVYFLGDLTREWVRQSAESNARGIVTRFEEHAVQMQRVATYSAKSEVFVHAARRGDIPGLRRAVAEENGALEYDGIAVLDANGRVVAASGLFGENGRERPFGKDIEPLGPGVGLRQVDGQPVLTAVSPISTGKQPQYRLVISCLVDDVFLGELGIGEDSLFCLYGPDGRLGQPAFAENLDETELESMQRLVKDPSPDLAALLARPAIEGTGRSISVDGRTYEARVEPLPTAGPDSAPCYLVGIVSQSASREAGRTTANLIMTWSVVAVVSLVGLGGWVARRVSDPLVELSAGARRIADGDFETKVPVSGASEIAELAQTFNQMTDSLRERSDSLTKKVQELATLYEMSRALGSTLDLDELLGSVLDSALRIFDLDLGYVSLRDKETGALPIRAIRGDGPGEGDGAVRSSMSEWVVREARPLIFNPEASGRASQVDAVTGAKAALCVPLVSPEGAIGSIAIGSSDPSYRFNGDDVRLLSTIANHVTIAVGNIELFTSLQEAYLATVRSLAAAVDAKDSYTRGHSDRVAAYATLIAERLSLSHEQRIALEMAAYLHDIGKIGVKEEILLKPGRLNETEMAQMRHHPLIGANILRPVAFPWAITPVVRHHHEYFDGGGYPAGLRGGEIPLLARILTVADSFEAMTADRPYREGRSVAEAIEELKACVGTQFDPRIVAVFVEILEEMERSGEAARGESAEEVQPEEARAIFSALVDGLFGSFRRLGGPRLASNVEAEFDAFLESHGMPFRIERGRVAFTAAAPPMLDGESHQMRLSLRRLDALMARVSGTTLVDHFYADALEGFSSRMRHLTRNLDFYDGN